MSTTKRCGARSEIAGLKKELLSGREGRFRTRKVNTADAADRPNSAIPIAHMNGVSAPQPRLNQHDHIGPPMGSELVLSRNKFHCVTFFGVDLADFVFAGGSFNAYGTSRVREHG